MVEESYKLTSLFPETGTEPRWCNRSTAPRLSLAATKVSFHIYDVRSEGHCLNNASIL
jgi:hypothetical protein